MIKKESLEEFIYQINTLITQSEFYSSYSKSIIEGRNDFKLSQVYTRKNYSTEWIDKIEDCINALDTIVRNPRRFISVEEDIVDVSLARSISIESVKHLAQHTNFISSVKKDGSVIPSKILNTSKEESFEIYENRFIYTLLLKVKDFINIRFEAIKEALLESGEIEVDLKSDFLLKGYKVSHTLGTSANIPFDAIVRPKAIAGGVSDVERITRLNNIISDFLRSAFAREMRTCALVRPPIQRTNVILKDPNFKKALLLWQFVVANEDMDFTVETSKETAELPPILSEKYRNMLMYNTLLMQSIAAMREEGARLEETKEEKEVADEYITKSIDDFVPDDFPHLKMELSEIRSIYYKIHDDKVVALTEISKMNAAIDRVLRQYEINKLEEEDKRRKELIAKQKKEEEEAKRLALIHAREEELRKKREEEKRIEQQKRIAEEELEAERKAEEERKEAERIAEIERRKQAEKQIRETMEAIVEETEAEFSERVAQERYEAEKRLRAEAERIARDLRTERETYWVKERDLAIKLLSERNQKFLSKRQELALEQLKKLEPVHLQVIRKMEALLRQATILEHNQNIEKLIDKARTFRSEEDILSILQSFETEKEDKEEKQ